MGIPLVTKCFLNLQQKDPSNVLVLTYSGIGTSDVKLLSLYIFELCMLEYNIPQAVYFWYELVWYWYYSAEEQKG